MLKVVTIFWRDIPSQVTVQAGRKRFKQLLDPRFQEAIDRAAMRAKKTDSDAYLEDWRRENKQQDGDPQAVLINTVAAIDAEFTTEKLESIVRNKGNAPAATQSKPSPVVKEA